MPLSSMYSMADWPSGRRLARGRKEVRHRRTTEPWVRLLHSQTEGVREGRKRERKERLPQITCKEVD